MALEILFLGTGTSTGVPIIGCRCRVCKSDDPRDNRTRPSILVRYAAGHDLTIHHPVATSHATTDNTGVTRALVDTEPAFNLVPPSHERTVRQYLIDTGPDMRAQIIRHDIDYIDAVFFTHAHIDHTAGLDDLRRFNIVMREPIQIYAEEHTFETIRNMFRYVFDAHYNVNKSFVPSVDVHLVAPGRPVTLHAARWTPLRLMHGRLLCAGYRVDFQGHSIAYCTDVSQIPQESYPLLENLDVLVIDGLRYTPHPTHMTIAQACREIERLKPKRAYLTHIAHDILHAEVEPTLPEHVYLAHDGLTVRAGP